MRNSRWLISFADLCLLLLGFFILLHAQRDQGAAVASMRAAFGTPGAPGTSDVREHPAAALFEPGEAVLRAAAQRQFAAQGVLAAAGKRRIRIESAGVDPSTTRFDGWELAAARAAAAARAIAAGGLPPDRIEIAMAPSDGPRRGQILRISTTR